MSTSAILVRLLPLSLAVGLILYFVGTYLHPPTWAMALFGGFLVLAQGILTWRIMYFRRE